MANTANQEETAGPKSQHPLRELASSLQNLAETVNSASPHIKINEFLQTCRLFPITNIKQFVFVYNELNDKVKSLERGSNPGETIQDLFRRDMEAGSAEWGGSLSRNVVRLKRMIDLFRVFFEQILANEESDSLFDPMSKAYDQVFRPYHFNSTKVAVEIAFRLFLPTKSTYLDILNEDENSAKEPLEDFIVAAKDVVSYIESVFLATELGAEILELI